jgi:hypothetical protein
MKLRNLFSSHKRAVVPSPSISSHQANVYNLNQPPPLENSSIVYKAMGSDGNYDHNDMNIEVPNILQEKYGNKLREGIDIDDTYTIYPSSYTSIKIQNTYCINCQFLILFDKKTQTYERIDLYKKDESTYTYQMTPYEIGGLKFEFLFTKKDLINTVTPDFAPDITDTQKQAFGLFYSCSDNPRQYYDRTIENFQKSNILV